MFNSGIGLSHIFKINKESVKLYELFGDYLNQYYVDLLD